MLIIFNNSLRTSRVPKEWKIQLVIPVHKKGNRMDPKTHRPIALTSGFSRVFELIAHEKTTSYLLQNSLLSDLQYGFLPGRSSCSQLLTSIYDWLWDFINHEQVDVVYMDIAKAFDTVSHAKLISVMKSYNIGIEFTNWLESFLDNRVQCVCIGKAVSSPRPVHSGVPQGGVVGPLVFVIYMDGILKNLGSRTNDVKMKLFADDSKIYSKNPEQLQVALNNCIAWTQNRQLKVAAHKCFQVSLAKNKPLPNNDTNYTIGMTILDKKISVSDLGVHISENLKWKEQCDLVYRKASRKCHLIMKCFKSRNIWVLLHLYKTYARPLTEFNSCVWSPYLKADISRIESIQKSFTRYAFLRCGLSFTSYADRIRQVGLKTLEERRLISDLVLLFRIVYGLSDIDFAEYFTFVTSNYSLRRNTMQIRAIKKHNNDQWRNLFFNRVIRVWNTLPEETVTAPTIMCFKNHVTKLDFSPFLKHDN